MTNHGIFGSPKGSTGRVPVDNFRTQRQSIDLVGDPNYGVNLDNSASDNQQIIMQAFSDISVGSKTGWNVYLRGAPRPYQSQTLTLPSVPFTFYGDGPLQSILFKPPD